MHVLTWETVESSGGDHADTLESFSSGSLSMLEEEGGDVMPSARWGLADFRL